MDINVKNIMGTTNEKRPFKRPFEVGETIYIPYKITEINVKQTGNTVLKQFHLDGPALNPNHETYTEHRLKDIFEAL